MKIISKINESLPNENRWASFNLFAENNKVISNLSGLITFYCILGAALKSTMVGRVRPSRN